MNAFFSGLLDNKKYLFFIITFILSIGFIYGFIWYSFAKDSTQQIFQFLYYLNAEKYTNKYQLYLIQNGLFIFISTYLSTSFIGYFVQLFFCFLKGIQLSFSLIYVFSIIDLSIVHIFIIMLETIFEIIFIFVISYMSINFSIYNLLITFYIEENFDIKKIINYVLNFIIISLLMFTFMLAFRIYFVVLL